MRALFKETSLDLSQVIKQTYLNKKSQFRIAIKKNTMRTGIHFALPSELVQSKGGQFPTHPPQFLILQIGTVCSSKLEDYFRINFNIKSSHTDKKRDVFGCAFCFQIYLYFFTYCTNVASKFSIQSCIL